MRDDAYTAAAHHIPSLTPLLPLSFPSRHREGGASGVGDLVTKYASLVGADVIVLGSRGMGSMKSALMSLVGLGSVSEYCMHQAPCPVLVVKHDSLSVVH